jgi:hypothetical protein
VDQGRKKKNRGDELIQVILYIRNTYIEMSQGNSPCSHIKQIKMSIRFFIKIGEQRTEQILSGKLLLVGGRRMWEKEIGG